MNKNKYKTQSLALASAIFTTSVAFLDSIEKDYSTNRATFCFTFTNKSNLDKIIKSFWNKDLNVDCLTYFENIKQIKNRLYAEKGIYEK